MTQRSYREEADALDAEILQCIARWSSGPAYGGSFEFGDDRFEFDFNDLALRIFAHQLRYNEPYAKYCASRGVTLDAMPADWEAIPPVPTGAYKEAALCTFDPARAALVFETSGTTQGVGGKHYMESAALYDASLLAGFRRGVLFDVDRPLRYLLLVPNPSERPHSSLGYMMREVAECFGDGRHAWYLQADELNVDTFVEDVRNARRDGAAACIAGTAFAFVNLLDELQARGISALALPPGSRIMETGGFKGRTRVVQRAQLYAELSALFSLPERDIVAEYGMTELTSQYYDDSVVTSLSNHEAARIKNGPPWLRPRVVGPDGRTLPEGVVGALVHVDLANRSSCVAIQTEDLGVATGGGIVLIGRERGAELRGCSLDAEQLRALAKT